MIVTVTEVYDGACNVCPGFTPAKFERKAA